MYILSTSFIQENLHATSQKYSSALEKLNSGIQVGAASDDASGLAIAKKLNMQAFSLSSAIRNGNSGIAMLQIADKAMQEQSSILDVIKGKLIQANSDTTSDKGREAILKDITKLLSQFDKIAMQTTYNGRQLISNDDATDAAQAHTMQLGSESSTTIDVAAIQANTSGLPPNGSTLSDLKNLNTLSTADAQSYQKVVDDSITKLNSFRSDIGSSQNQVQSAVRNLLTQYTNIKAASAAITDTDFSTTSAEFRKQGMIMQAGQFALAQANSMQKNILRLLV